jgi:hypothetical protein
MGLDTWPLEALTYRDVVGAVPKFVSKPRTWVLPLRHPEERARPVTHVRSSAVVTAQSLLRASGKHDAYAATLEPGARSAVLEVVPGVWVPVDTALAHYRAIDGLQLTATEQAHLANGAGEKMQGAVTSTILRMSRAAGVTPWLLLPHSQRIWDRICRGGDLSVERIGPKEAMVRMFGLPLFSSPYFRLGIRCVLQTGLSFWSTRCYVTEVGWTPTSATFREAWA